jgi:acyl-CoA synthetase (AMP-forming)/AMP-acid ligase II
VAPSITHNVGLWTTRRAELGGDRVAVVDGERSLDYAALHERTCRAAAVLAGRGVARGDRVGLLLRNRSAYLETVFAAARLGAIAVPINARFTAHEIRRVLEDCTPKLLLHEADLAAVAEAALAGLPAPPGLLACPEAYEPALANATPLERVEPVTPDDPMILLYTSGTTGVPKGALLPHRKTLFNSLNAQLFFELRADDRVLVVLPLFHSFGLLILSLPTLYAGGRLLLAGRFDARETWQTVAEQRITFLGAVPTQLQALLEAEPARDETRSLRFLFGAGAAVPVEQIRAFERRGILLKQGFGQTETSILCCLEARDAVRKAGSVGRPVFHADVRVVRLEDLERPAPRRCGANGCARAIWRASTRRASSASSAAPATSTSPAARTSTPRRSSGCWPSIRRSPRSRSSACQIPAGARPAAHSWSRPPGVISTTPRCASGRPNDSRASSCPASSYPSGSCRGPRRARCRSTCSPSARRRPTQSPLTEAEARGTPQRAINSRVLLPTRSA